MRPLEGTEAERLAFPDQQVSLTDPDARSMAASGHCSGIAGSDRAPLSGMAKPADGAGGRDARCGRGSGLLRKPGDPGRRAAFHRGTNVTGGLTLRRYRMTACGRCAILDQALRSDRTRHRLSYDIVEADWQLAQTNRSIMAWDC